MFLKKLVPSSPCLVQWNWPHTDQWWSPAGKLRWIMAGRVQVQPTCTWDTDLSTCTVQSAAAVPTSIIKSSSREQGATLAIKKRVEYNCLVVLCYVLVGQMSHEKKPSYFPLCWLFNRDPSTVMLFFTIIPIYTLNNRDFCSLLEYAPITTQQSCW